MVLSFYSIIVLSQALNNDHKQIKPQIEGLSFTAGSSTAADFNPPGGSSTDCCRLLNPIPIPVPIPGIITVF